MDNNVNTTQISTEDNIPVTEEKGFIQSASEPSNIAIDTSTNEISKEAHENYTNLAKSNLPKSTVLAFETLKQANINLTTDLLHKLDEGDFSSLENLADKGGNIQKAIEVLREHSEQMATKDNELIEQTKQEVSSILDTSNTSTAEITEWFNKNADESSVKCVNELFELGGTYAIIAARALKNTYLEKVDTVKSTYKPLNTTNNSSIQGISKKEYSDEITKLHSKLGARLSTSEEYAKLNKRRELGLKLGI